jgi:hypothetical protein
VLPPFDQYLANLTRLTTVTDPTALTPEAGKIRVAAHSLEALATVDRESLAGWANTHADAIPTLGLVVGLSQEKLKNALRERLGSSAWLTLARERPAELVALLDDDFRLVELLEAQRRRAYEFGDVLVARAGTRTTARGAATAGRLVEDQIEEVALRLKLPYETRTRFQGRDHRTGPCDLAVPGAPDAQIVVAAKGFDSTGSKLTDAVREVQEMASVRRPAQYVMAVIDGIGWLSRKADLRTIYDLCDRGEIDGLYTITTIDEFQADLTEAAARLGLL